MISDRPALGLLKEFRAEAQYQSFARIRAQQRCAHELKLVQQRDDQKQCNHDYQAAARRFQGGGRQKPSEESSNRLRSDDAVFRLRILTLSGVQD